MFTCAPFYRDVVALYHKRVVVGTTYFVNKKNGTYIYVNGTELLSDMYVDLMFIDHNHHSTEDFELPQATSRKKTCFHHLQVSFNMDT